MEKLPFKEFKKEDFGNRQTIRDNAQRGEEIQKIDLNKIIVRENFNIREDMGDLESLADSLEQNGQTLPGIVDIMADGNFVLVEGHRRVLAWQIVWERTGTMPKFKATVNATATTEKQRLIQMFTTQDNKQLTPAEQAKFIARFVNLGYTPSEVAREIGKSPTHIANMLDFEKESQIIKDQVKAGNLTVAGALKLKKQIPVESERVTAVQEAANKKLPTVKKIKVFDVAGFNKTEQAAKDIIKLLGEQYPNEVFETPFLETSIIAIIKRNQ